MSIRHGDWLPLVSTWDISFPHSLQNIASSSFCAPQCRHAFPPTGRLLAFSAVLILVLLPLKKATHRAAMIKKVTPNRRASVSGLDQNDAPAEWTVTAGASPSEENKTQ